MTAVSGLAPPAGRQGPGPVPEALVQALELRLSRRAGGVLPGEHRALGVGSGAELFQLRPYQPGDDVRQLDAAATARTLVPHVRQHVPERLLTTWIVLDVSPSMAFGSADRLKSDVAEGVAEVVGRIGLRRGGRVALLSFGGPKPRLLAPRGGRGALMALRKALSEGTAEDGAPGVPLEHALVRLARLARQPGLAVLVSDFAGERDWKRPLALLGARHSLIAVEIGDPLERELPAAGVLRLVDPESGTRIEVDTGSSELRRRFAEAARAEREEVAAHLRHAGAEHVVVSTDGPWLKRLGTLLA